MGLKHGVWINARVNSTGLRKIDALKFPKNTKIKLIHNITTMDTLEWTGDNLQ